MHIRMAGAVGLVLAGALAGTARADEWDQIAALQRIKASLTPAERKLDSRVAVELKRGTASGTREVDIRGAVSARKLRDLGAVIRAVTKASVRAAVPVDKLETIARWPEVKRIDESVGAITATIRPPGWTPSEKTPERRRAAPVVSEGDAAHAADIARAQARVSGVGVKVCVLSDGVDSLADSQAAGELPDVDVLPGQAGEGDEGTAMLEIVHDLAPKAELGFATAFESDASFAENIRALRFDAGCDVIADDVLYFNESPFQDGPIAQSVNAVTADGALYFSSAGNEGNTLDGTSGNYEGDFADSGQAVGKFAGAAHDFDPGPGVQVFEPISDASSAGVPVTLFWADRLGAAADDYDLYLFDAAGNVVSFSQDVQDGDDDPYEILGTPGFGGAGLKLAVVKFSGAAKYLQLSALRGRFSDSSSLKAFVSPGVTRGHSAAAAAFSVAAAPAADPLPFDLEPGDPPNPSGPFPHAFAASQLPERFTSDGPRRMFFPQPAVRQKPDITAADGVSTSLEDFTPFFGTSAAAPHAAAIAALVLSGNPGATSSDVREAFDATALDLAPAGVDARTGHGLLRADAVLDYTGATPQPLVNAQAPTVTVTDGDGDAYLEAGETASLALPVSNDGDGTATGVSVRASSDDAPVTPRTQSYGDLTAGSTRTRTYSVTLPDDYPLGKPLALNVRVSFAGAYSPTTATFSLPTGQPASSPTAFAYAGPPVAIPDDDEAGASVEIPVDMEGYASKLTFSIDGSSCNTTAGSETVGIDHTFAGDLIGTLTSPSGATATLFTHEGGGGNNFCQVVFDDAAADPFTSADTAPFTGTWRPEDPLAGLMGAPVAGAWRFTAADTAAVDTGSIRAVSLHITGYVR